MKEKGTEEGLMEKVIPDDTAAEIRRKNKANLIEKYSELPLFEAIVKDEGLVPLVRCASVHRTDADGRTPLHIAAKYNCSEEVVKFLLRRGADVNARDDEGKTPLAFEDGWGHQSVVNLIKEAGGRYE